jgi:GTP-binding protein HflX
VNVVLAEIGADAIPQVIVLNKIDLTQLSPRVERDEYGKIARIWISAESGAGLDSVRFALEEHASAALPLAGDQRPAAA